MPESTAHSDGWGDNYVVRRRRLLVLGDRAPIFEIPRNDKRVGFVLGNATDWDEVRELVTDSYCMIAPKNLIAVLDLPS